MRKVLIVGLAAVAAASPALAAGGGGSFKAVDNEWLANGGAEHELTIAPGETVTFSYPSGNSFHFVKFEDPQPATCTGIEPDDPSPGWTGSCRFDAPGTYRFVCGIHAEMTGRVIVPAPTPTSTPGATATPAPAATPPPATLKLTLAKTQRSLRVRGAVEIDRPGSRLEVTVRTTRRVGRFLRRSATGHVVFSVGLDAKARRTLRSQRRLRVSVRVALTPPGAKALIKTTRVTLTSG
jgi:plastocyanin